MSKPGRKRTPTPVLKLRGSWRAKERKDVEVIPGVPKRPRGLDDIAKKYWDRTVAELTDMGILAKVDWSKLQILSEYWSEMERLKRYCKEPIIKSKEGGETFNQNLYALIKLRKEYTKLASEFCIGPTNRAGMGGIQDNEKDDEKSKFFRKNG